MNQREPIAEREVALSILREGALSSLLNEGIASTYTSQFAENKNGVEISTKGSPAELPAELDFSASEITPFSPKAFTHQYFQAQVTDLSGKSIETDSLDLSFALMSPSDKGKVILNRSGLVSQNAVGLYDQADNGHIGSTTEVDFNIHDPQLLNNADIKLNMTISEPTENDYIYRGVLRDGTNHVLGIIEQDVNVDSNGNIYKVLTSARPSAYDGQIVAP